MLKFSINAKFEATTLGIYVVEADNGLAQRSYIKPYDIFATYDNPELDTIFFALRGDSSQCSTVVELTTPQTVRVRFKAL